MNGCRIFSLVVRKPYDCIDVMMRVSPSQMVVGFSLVVRKILRLYRCDDECVYQSNG